jgi:hypothetical protein
MGDGISPTHNLSRPMLHALCLSVDIAPTVSMGYIRRTPNVFV